MLILEIIIAILVIIIIYLIRRKPEQDNKLPMVQPDNTLYRELLYDLDDKNTFAPWEELLVLKLADPNDIAPYLYHDIYISHGEFDRLSGLSIPKKYKVKDLLFVYWRSSQQSWDHLAGREGYIVISKTEKRQVDFIITVLS